MIRFYSAQDPCYADYVQRKSKQNLTLVIEEDLLQAARKAALDRGTSVNRLVREFLTSLTDDSGRARLARARLKKTFAAGLVDVGELNWSREDLYER